MNVPRALGLFIFSITKSILARLSPSANTKLICFVLKRCGAKINGKPNYIGYDVWFDGTDLQMLSLGVGCTISNKVIVLLHDWASATIAVSLGTKMNRRGPIGIKRRVVIGPYSFIGIGSIILPGAKIGKGAIIGAGSVIRGKVESYAVVVGNPAIKIGDSRDLVRIYDNKGKTNN